MTGDVNLYAFYTFLFYEYVYGVWFQVLTDVCVSILHVQDNDNDNEVSDVSSLESISDEDRLHSLVGLQAVYWG